MSKTRVDNLDFTASGQNKDLKADLQKHNRLKLGISRKSGGVASPAQNVEMFGPAKDSENFKKVPFNSQAALENLGAKAVFDPNAVIQTVKKELGKWIN